MTTPPENVLADEWASPADGRLQLRTLASVEPRQVAWLVPGLIQLRALNLVAGIGGLGKSTWLAAVAAQVSAGRLLGGSPGDVIIVSFEDSAEEGLRPRVEAAEGDLHRVHDIVVGGDGLDTVALPRDTEELRQLARSVTARLVIFDPIVAGIESSFDTHKDQHVRAVLAQLLQLALEEECAIAMVGHLNKTPSVDAYVRVANSVAFWNASRSVILIAEDPDDENCRLIVQRKANYARLRGVERHRMETVVLPDTVDPGTGRPIETSRLVFVEVADEVDGAEVLNGQKTTKTETAETLLEALLADGEWHEADAVKKLLAAAGFPERTAQRAAKFLHVENERRGFPGPKTWWRLPSAPSTPPRSGAYAGTAQASRSSASSAPYAPTLDGEGAPALPADAPDWERAYWERAAS